MRTRKLVAVDLDGVVVDLVSVMLPKLSELAGRIVTHEDINVFDIGEALGLSKDAMDELWDWLEKREAYVAAPPIEGAAEALRSLGSDAVHLVTCRRENLRDQTARSLEHLGLQDYRLVMGLSPQKIVSPGHFFALVEDNPTDLCSVAPNVELVLLYDQPWNRVAPTVANLARVHTWPEVLQLLGNS
jgi:uncharacterized HAD superfamily protein